MTSSYALRLSPPPQGATNRAFYWPREGVGSFVATHCYRSSIPGAVRPYRAPRPLRPRLGVLGPVPKPNIDFVWLATAVYAADRSTPRRSQGSNWSQREISIRIPVSDPDTWNAIGERLEDLLAFLSGDQWSLDFVPARVRREPEAKSHAAPHRVMLLSGGADSIAGAVISQRDSEGAQQLFVSHVGVTSLFPIQQTIVTMVEDMLGGEMQHHQIHLVRRSRQPNGVVYPDESSTRTRSLLFIALGLALASIHGVPLWMPENGFASLNPPLTADQRGSLSTRTTHPSFLGGLTPLLAEAGVHADLANPFSNVTKGEIFRDVAAVIGIKQASALLSATHSCAHTGHRSLGLSTRLQCGVCFGCLVRRAAFLASAIPDQTLYLKDIAHPGLASYLATKSMEGSMLQFLDRGLRTSDIVALSLPGSYDTREAFSLCDRAAAELRLLFP